MYARYEPKPRVQYDLEADPKVMKNLIGNAALIEKMDAQDWRLLVVQLA